MLIKETGLGLSNANTYAERAQADRYHALMGNADWAEASEQARDAALAKATSYLDTRYVFRSVRASEDQALEYPRHGSDTIPAKLVEATIILARHALTMDLTPVITERDVKTVAKGLDGVGSTSVTYADQKVNDPFPHITALLRQIATRYGASVSVIRLTR